jgi:putative nucleotidyltransferase with HDIG domain
MKAMKEKVLQAIPEFKLIKNKALREKALATWCEAMQTGGWTVADLKKMPFTLLIEKCPASMIDHVRAVTQSAVKITEAFNAIYGRKLPVKHDYLVAGALLHDVGKLLEYERKGKKFVKSAMGKVLRHPFSGVGIGYKHNLPPEVLHMIGTHSHEGDHGKRTVEGVIINHADFVNFESLKARG